MKDIDRQYDRQHAQMIKKLLQYDRNRQDRYRKFHLCDDIHLGMNGIASAGNALRYKKPHKNADDHPVDIGNA